MTAGGDAATVIQRCDVLGACSEEPGRLTRPFASPAMQQVHEHVASWMREAGMTVRKDNVGNLLGRYESAHADAPTLLLGSHLDSVRNAGKYDGPLGVMVALAAVQRLQNSGSRLPFAIEVVAFAAEEGLRYGIPYLGSRALAGVFDMTDLQRTDAQGVTMADAIHIFGGDPERLADDRWHGGDLLGYVEVHIEQGPVLEARGLPVGVVSEIVGQSRHHLTFRGEAAHAGTTPMNRRKDALVAAAVFVQAVEDYASARDGMVATVGQLAVQPGAVNVVPGEVTMSLDVRHPDDAKRHIASERLIATAKEIAQQRGIAMTAGLVSENAKVACSPRLAALLTQVVQDGGHPAMTLGSGAGHDAVVMAGITDVAMLFVRCKGGISHNPAESVTEEDAAVAIDVLGKFMELLPANS
jgi:allantoate deiminase